SDRAKEVLAEKGYDPVFGARPLKRAVQKYLQDPLSLKILNEDFTEGDEIYVDSHDAQTGFNFTKTLV
ncbi:MAG: hypothetical protein F3745_08150, partial [Nitrospinae bacterium]|nr:hypothetical protein [Nitrospinota bacterium]